MLKVELLGVVLAGGIFSSLKLWKKKKRSVDG